MCRRELNPKRGRASIDVRVRVCAAVPSPRRGRVPPPAPGQGLAFDDRPGLGVSERCHAKHVPSGL